MRSAGNKSGPISEDLFSGSSDSKLIKKLKRIGSLLESSRFLADLGPVESTSWGRLPEKNVKLRKNEQFQLKRTSKLYIVLNKLFIEITRLLCFGNPDRRFYATPTLQAENSSSVQLSLKIFQGIG